MVRIVTGALRVLVAASTATIAGLCKCWALQVKGSQELRRCERERERERARQSKRVQTEQETKLNFLLYLRAHNNFHQSVSLLFCFITNQVIKCKQLQTHTSTTWIKTVSRCILPQKHTFFVYINLARKERKALLLVKAPKSKFETPIKLASNFFYIYSII